MNNISPRMTLNTLRPFRIHLESDKTLQSRLKHHCIGNAFQYKHFARTITFQNLPLPFTSGGSIFSNIKHAHI